MKLSEIKKELLNVKTLSVDELAKLHDVSVDDINKELSKGITSELEHTSNKSIAREIALDHLKELPDYYTKLSGIE